MVNAEARDGVKIFRDTVFMAKNKHITSDKWVSIRDLYPDGAHQPLLPQTFSRDQFGQGNHYECFMLSALSTLIRFPDVIRHCFVTKKVRQDGRYTFQFFRGKEWVKVEIDDSIAMENGETLYVRSPTQHWWPLLLEKAYAKFYTGYDHLEGCTLEETFHDLTGNPVLNVPMEVKLAKTAGFFMDNVQAWLTLGEYLRNGDYVASTLTKDIYLESMGIQSEQQYAILDVFPLDTSVARTPTLDDLVVHLYNPFEDDEYAYSGPLSREDEAWSPELRAKHPEVDDRHAIFMPYPDFIRIVNSIQLCFMTIVANDATYFVDEWKGITAGGNPTYVTWRNNPLYLMKNNSGMDLKLVVVLKQEDQRRFTEQDESTKYVQCGVVLSRATYPNPKPTFLVTGNNHKSIYKSLFLNSREVANTITIPPCSTCYLVPSTMNTGTEAKYTLALYRLRQQDYSRFSISKLMIPSINFDHPAKQSVKIHRGGHERVDFVVDEPTDVHILMHQTKPYISPYGGDAMTEDYVGMYLYNDEDKKIGGVHAATNYRETSVIHHLPQGGRYALSLTCPRTKEDEVVPLILSIAATPSANARFVETPAGAATFTDDADNRVDAFDDNQYPFLDPVPEGVPLSKLPLEEDASFQQNMSARSAMLEEKDPDLSAVRQLEENMNDRSHELARSLISNERPSYLSGRDLDKLNPLLDANEHYMDVERARYALKEDPQNATLVQLHERLLGEMADAVAAGEDPKVPLARYMSSNSLDTTQDGGESVAVEKEEDAETRAAREAAEAKERAELRPGYLESAYEGRELSTIPLEEDQQFRHVEDDYLAQTVKNTENTNTAEAHRLRGSMDEMATDLAKAMNVNDRTAFLPETVEGKSARELPLSADEEFCELERKRAEILSKDPGMANSEEVKELEEKMRARAAIIAAEEQAHKDDDDVGTADDVDAESSHGRKKKSPNASATKSTESALASKNVSPRLDRVQRSVVSKEEMERIIAQMDQRPMGIAIRFLPLEQDPIFNDLCEAYVDVPTTGRPTADEIKARRDVLIQRMNDRAGELATTVHDTERATLEQRPEGIPLKALPLDEDEKFVGLEREARDIRGKPKLVPADTIHLETIQSDLNERARELAHRVRKEYVDAEPEGIPIEQLRLGNEPDFLTTEAERRMLINEGGDNAEAVGEINRKLNVMAREVAKARMQGDRGYLDRNPEGLPLRVVPLDEDAKFGAMERERARLIAGRHSGAPGNKQKIKDIEQQLNERAHELALEQKERDLDGVGQSPRGIPIASLHPHDDPQFAALLAEVRQLKKDTEANRDEINRLKASMNQRCTDMANDMVVGDRAYLAPRPLGVPIALLPIDKDAEFREMEARRAALKAEDARYHAAAILELEDRLNQRATELAKERMAQELSGLDQCPERVPLDIVKPYNDKIFLSSVDELRELDSTNINDERVRPIKLKMNERCHGLAWSMIEDSRDFLIKDPKGVPIEELPIDNDTAFRELEAQRVVLQHTRGSANKIRGIEDQLNVRVLELADDRLRRDLEGVHPQPEGVSLETIMPHSDPDFAALVEKRRAVERSMGHEESAEERAEKRAELTSIVEALNERARELARGILARDRSYLDRNPEGVPISILPIDTDERFKKLETERTTLKVKDARRNASRIKELEALLNERAHQLALEQKKADLEGLNPEPLGVSLELLRPHSDAQFGQLVNEIRRLRAEDPRDEEAITTCINAMDERAKAMMMKVMARNFLDQEPDGIPLCQLPLDRDEEFRKTEIQRAVMRLTDSRRNASKICELEDKMNQRAHQLAMLQRDVDIECVDEAPCGVPKGLLNLHRDGECGGKLIPELRILKKNPEANVEKIRELEKELDARAHVLARNIVDGDRETYLDPCPLGIPLSDLPLDSDVKFKRMEVSRATLRAQSAKTNTAAIKALEIELNDRAHDLARTVMDDDLKPFDAEYEGVAVKSMKPHQDKVFAENAAQRRRLLREGGPDSEAMVEDCTTTMRSRLIELAKERKNGEFYFLDRDPEGVPLEDIPMSTDETFNELRARREHLKEEDAFAHRDAIVGLEKQMNDRVRQLAKGVLASDFTGVDTHPLGIHIDLLRPRLDPEIVRLIPELRRARRTNYLKNRVPTIEGQMDDRLHVLATNALIEGREDYLPARPEGVPLEILALDADQMFHDGEVRRAILRLSDRTANSTAIREIEKELVARSRELAKDQLHEDLRGIDKEPHGIPLEMLHPHSDPTLSVMISEIRVLKKDPIRFANKIKNQQDAMNERAHDIALDLLEQHREFLDPAPLGVPLADLPLLRDEDFHTDEVSRVNAILHGDRAEEIPELEKRLRRRSEELARKQLNDDLAGLVPAPLGVPLTLLEPHKDERFAEFIPVLRRLIKDPSVNAAKLKSLRVKMDERNLELAEDFLMRDREVYLDPEPEGMRWELLPLNSSAEFKEAEGKKLFLQSKNVEAGREPSDGNSEKISSLERKLNTIAHSIAVQQLRRDRCYLDTNPEGVPLDILPLDTDPTFRTLEASRAAAKARHANAQAGELEDQLNARAHELALEQKAEDLRGLDPFPRGMALADLQPHDDPTFAGLVDEIRLLKASTKNKEKSIRAVQKRMDGVASDMADSLLKRDRGYLHLKPEFVPLRRLPLDANDDFHALEVKRATLKLENTNKNASRIVELEAELNELARELARAVKAKDLQGLTPKPRGIPIELLDPHKSDKFSGMVEEKANLSPEAQAEPNNSTMRALNLFVEQLADSTLKGDRGYLDREPEGVAFTLLPLDSDAAFHELEVERAVLRMTDMQKNLGAIHELQDQLNRRAHELARILLGKDRGYLNPAPEGVPLEVLPLDTDTKFHQMEVDRAKLKSRETSTNSARVRELENRLNARAVELAKKQLEEDVAGLDREPQGYPMIYLFPHSDAEFAANIPPLRAAKAKEDMQHVRDLQSILNSRAHEVAKMRIAQDRSFLNRAPEGVPLELLPLDTDGVFRGAEKDLRGWKAATKKNDAAIQDAQKRMIRRANELARAYLKLSREFLDQEPEGVPLADVALDEDATFRSKEKERLQLLVEPSETTREKVVALEQKLNERAHELARERKASNRWFLNAKSFGVPKELLLLDEDADFIDYEKELLQIMKQEEERVMEGHLQETISINGPAMNVLRDKMQERADIVGKEQVTGDRDHYIEAQIGGVDRSDIPLDEDEEYMNLEVSRAIKMAEAYGKRTEEVKGMERQLAARAYALARALVNADRSFLPREICGIPIDELPLDTDEKFGRLERQLRAHKRAGQRDEMQADEDELKRRAHELAKDVIAQDLAPLRDTYRGIPKEDLNLHSDTKFRELSRLRRKNRGRAVTLIEDEMDQRANKIANELIAREREFLDQEPEGMYLADVPLDSDATFCQLEAEYRRRRRDPLALKKNVKVLTELAAEMNQRSHTLARMEFAKTRDFMDPEPEGVQLVDLALDEDPKFKDAEIARYRNSKRRNCDADLNRDMEQKMNDRAHELALAMLAADREFLDPQPEGVPIEVLELNQDHEFRELARERRTSKKSLKKGMGEEQVKLLEEKMNYRAHEIAKQFLITERAFMDQEPEGVPLDDLPLNSDAPFRAMENQRLKVQREGGAHSQRKLTSLEADLNSMAHKIARELLKKERGFLDAEPMGVPLEELPLNHDTILNPIERRRRQMRKEMKRYHDEIRSCEDQMADRVNEIANNFIEMERAFMDQEPEGVPLRYLPLLTDKEFHEMELQRRKSMHRPASSRDGIERLERKMNDRAHALAKDLVQKGRSFLDPEPLGVPIADVPLNGDEQFRKLEEQRRSLKQDPRNATAVKVLEERLNDRAYELAQDLLNVERAFMNQSPEGIALEDLPLNDDRKMQEIERKRRAMRKENPEQNAIEISVLEDAMENRAHELATKQLADDRDYLDPEPCGVPLCDIPLDGDHSFHTMELERHNLKKKTHGNGDKIVVLEMKLNERAHQLASQLIKKERAYLDQEPEGIPLDRLPLDRDHSFHSMELERRQLLRESQCAAAVKELESSLNRRAHELAKEVRGWQDKDFHTANEHIGEEWLRICELFPDGRLQSLEPESPAVSDVGSAPGDVGYLAPFLAALSRYPVLLQRLIATKEHPINGPYTFIFFDPCSNPVFVDIDDRVPCTSDFMPRFIQSPNRLWYPLLLEKAYAKFVGGYEQMDICTPHETLRDLTGRPVTHLPFDRKLAEAANIGDYTSTAFWRDVSDGLSHGDVMLCMSKNEPSEMDGLHPQCSYALLSVIETVPGSNNPSDIVIKIHNAYRGYKPVYRGPLARDDQNWTDELRRVCKFEYDREDWIFLPLPTFLRSFSSMQRCHINCGDRVTAMGSWDRQTSGGNPKYTTFRNNPIYLLENKGSRAATVLAELRHKEPSFADPDGVNHYPQTGLVLMQPIVPTMPPTSLLTNSTHKFLQKGMMLDSREVCSVMQLPANSTCYVVPYTMKKGQTGAFQLSVYPGMAKVSLTPLNAGLSKEPVSTRITLNPGEEGRRVDFHLSAGGDVHILLHQEKITEARSVSRGDIVAEDEVSMAVYSDDGIKLATSGETTNAREHSLVFKASESGRYSLWLCAPSPSVSGDCPLVVSIYTTKRMTAKFIPLPLRARTPQRFPAIPPKTAPHGNPSGSRQRGRLGNNNAATAVENPQHAGTLPVIARRPSMSTTSSSVVRPMSSGQ